MIKPVVGAVGEDWIGPRHATRFIREFVAALDLRALGLDKLNGRKAGWRMP